MSRITQIFQKIMSVSEANSDLSSNLVNSISVKGASVTELSDLEGVDVGLLEFWRLTKTAELFKDRVYGQWGLRILTPAASQKLTQDELVERPREMLSTDLLFAEFLGDSDQLLMDLAFDHAEHKPIYVKSPLDRRYDWPKAADSFEEFLEKYVKARGEKFRESGIV